jgi:hypothetical protein
MRMLVSCLRKSPNYQNGSVSNQLTDVERGSVFEVTVNLLIRDRGLTALLVSVL